MTESDFKISKMSGTGNDFYIVDARSVENQRALASHFQNLKRPEIARRLCGRQGGQGADGLVFIDNKSSASPADFKWDFYNADGSTAEMCGNAARCISLYTTKNNITGPKLSFETVAGVVGATVLDGDMVDVEMPAITAEKLNQSISVDSAKHNYDFINSGVPHVVIKTNDLDNTKTLELIGKSIRQHQDFAPAGANVTFYSPLSDSEIRAMSFERGVEGFTLACGTGAVAAARSHSVKNSTNQNNQVTVQVPGGTLKVNFEQSRPHLIGPAQFVTELSLNEA